MYPTATSGNSSVTASSIPRPARRIGTATRSPSTRPVVSSSGVRTVISVVGQVADRLERQGQGQALGQRSEHRRRRVLGSELRQQVAGERVIHDGHGHARILPGVAEPPLTEDAVARDGLPDHGEAATMAP